VRLRKAEREAIEPIVREGWQSIRPILGPIHEELERVFLAAPAGLGSIAVLEVMNEMGNELMGPFTPPLAPEIGGR
jgi:hypothetical protein